MTPPTPTDTVLTEQRVRELRDTVAETIRRPSHIPDGEWTQARGIVALCDAWLASHNAQDAVNARRYMWLRHGDNDEPVILHDPFTGNGFLLRDEHLDAAIDAQLAALALANQEKV